MPQSLFILTYKALQGKNRQLEGSREIWELLHIFKSYSSLIQSELSEQYELSQLSDSCSLAAHLSESLWNP